jgi:hypothetical protein
MGQHRPRPGGEHRGHPAPGAREDGVADRVHPVMQSMQPAGADAVRDRVVVEPKAVELPAGDDAVLAVGERRDRAIHAGPGGYL